MHCVEQYDALSAKLRRSEQRVRLVRLREEKRRYQRLLQLATPEFTLADRSISASSASSASHTSSSSSIRGARQTRLTLHHAQAHAPLAHNGSRLPQTTPFGDRSSAAHSARPKQMLHQGAGIWGHAPAVEEFVEEKDDEEEPESRDESAHSESTQSMTATISAASISSPPVPPVPPVPLGNPGEGDPDFTQGPSQVATAIRSPAPAAAAAAWTPRAGAQRETRGGVSASDGRQRNYRVALGPFAHSPSSSSSSFSSSPPPPPADACRTQPGLEPSGLDGAGGTRRDLEEADEERLIAHAPPHA